MRLRRVCRDLYIIILLHVLFLANLLLNWINPSINTTPLRAPIVVVYLTIVPGYLLIRRFLLSFFNDFITIVAHSVGLSLSLIMFIGLTINTVMSYLGVKNPISEKILGITFFIINTFLIILNLYYYKLTNSSFKKFNIRGFILYLTILLLLPVISIVGSFEFLYRSNNSVYLLLLFLISVIAIMLVFIRKINTNFYPILVLSMSVGLQFYGSLSSKYVCVIGDTEIEYHFANLVLLNSVWRPDIYANQNAMLSVTMLLPIYSMLSGLDLNLSFKIIYPLIFSITPIAIYKLLTKQFTEEISLISCFLFMFSFQFYNAYALSVRWGVGLIFLILISYLMIIYYENNTKNIKTRILLLIYSLALIVSHYGTSYLFMFTIILVFLLHVLLKHFLKINQTLSFGLGYITFYVVANLGYYIYTASSSPFNISITFFRHVFDVIATEFLSPKASQVIFAIEREWPISVKISQFLILFIVFINIIGVLSIAIYYLIRRINTPISYTYLLISIVLITYSLISLIQSMFTPQRIYYISLPLLAPFSVIGFHVLLYLLYNRKKLYKLVLNINVINDKGIIMFVLLLVIYFLFTSGFMSEILIKNNDYSPTVFISKNRANDINDPYFIYALNRRYTPEVDVFSAIWLSSHRDLDKRIYVDMGGHGKGYIGWAPLYSYGMINLTEPIKGSIIYMLDPERKSIRPGSYVYLRQYACTEKILFRGPPLEYYNISEINLQGMHKIYDNGACIYLSR